MAGRSIVEFFHAMVVQSYHGRLSCLGLPIDDPGTAGDVAAVGNEPSTVQTLSVLVAAFGVFIGDEAQLRKALQRERFVIDNDGLWPGSVQELNSQAFRYR